MTPDEDREADNTSKAAERARKMRNYAIAGILGFLVLFFLMTIVRLGGHVVD
jgi:hypothetical protein